MSIICAVSLCMDLGERDLYIYTSGNVYMYIHPYLPVPAPTVSVTSTTATSISLSWSVPSGSVVTSYEVMWQRDTSGQCPDTDEGSTTITDGSTNYEIMGLEEDSNYSLTDCTTTSYIGCCHRDGVATDPS